jgi:hypothetical protein
MLKRIMILRVLPVMIALGFALPGVARAQFEQAPVKVFGFFQLNFQQYDGSTFFANSNSFSLQQLNLFLQRDLDTRMRAFVNLQFVNNFSTSQNWGSFEVAEAWLSYRQNRALNLKAGLLLPRFNHLNDIKDKTALLPYIIRPIVYESSFNEIIRLEEYLPQRAYIEVYGNHRLGDASVNYSAYVGNSPNVNSNPIEGQTGVDTTNTFLVGGRLGFEYDFISAGASATYDRTNVLAEAATLYHLEVNSQEFREIPRTRLGADLRLHYRAFSLEAEWIDVGYGEDSEFKDLDFDFDLKFYYYTLFYEPIYGLKIYNGYWYSKDKAIDSTGPSAQFVTPLLGDFALELRLPTTGVAYTLRDKLTLKFQYARVREKIDLRTERGDLHIEDEFNYIVVGFSVFL